MYVCVHMYLSTYIHMYITESTEVTDLTEHTDQIKRSPDRMTRERKGYGMLLFLLCEIF